MSLATLCRHDVRRLPSGAWCCRRCHRVGHWRDGFIEWNDPQMDGPAIGRLLADVERQPAPLASDEEAVGDAMCGERWDGMA